LVPPAEWQTSGIPDKPGISTDDRCAPLRAHRAAPSQRKTRTPDARACRSCGASFHPSLDAVSRGGGWYCSHPCRSRAPRNFTSFKTPESTKEERVRANGLVNKRLKLGWFTRPTHCQKCGAEKKLDTHHPDYSKPDEVLFLCRSCHMNAHHDPSTVARLRPINTDQRKAISGRGAAS
jgi:hypothetical protein